MAAEEREEIEQMDGTPVDTASAGTPPADLPPASTVVDSETEGLKAALEAERQKRQETERLVNQILMSNAQAMQQQAVQPQGQGDDIISRMGVKPEDLYEQDGLRKLGQGIQNLINQRVQQQVTNMSTQQFMAEHPDFTQVVGQSYGQSFVPSAAYNEACRRDPSLSLAVQGLMNAGDPLSAMRLAYDRASAAASPQTPSPVGPNVNIPGVPQQAAAQVAPTSPTSVGGGGAFGAAATVANMSDEEFERLDAQAAGTPG